MTLPAPDRREGRHGPSRSSGAAHSGPSSVATGAPDNEMGIPCGDEREGPRSRQVHLVTSESLPGELAVWVNLQ